MNKKRSLVAALTTASALAIACFAPNGFAAPISSQGTWQTTLQARDTNGDKQVDAYYDTVLNVTWLANANANGLMNWNAAHTWATTLAVNGSTGWRLPTVQDTASLGCNNAFSGTDCGFNVQTSLGQASNNELAHLYYLALGNVAFCSAAGQCPQLGEGLTNSAEFLNMQAGDYWSGTTYALNASQAWLFSTSANGSAGFQGFTSKSGAAYAIAVHDGDIGAGNTVPLPGTAALT